MFSLPAEHFSFPNTCSHHQQLDLNIAIGTLPKSSLVFLCFPHTSGLGNLKLKQLCYFKTKSREIRKPIGISRVNGKFTIFS